MRISEKENKYWKKNIFRKLKIILTFDKDMFLQSLTSTDDLLIVNEKYENIERAKTNNYYYYAL